MPKKPAWAKPKAPKAVKELFKAKKEVTVKDAKRLKPLTNYWAGRLKEARDSDNWRVFFVGVVIGAALFAIASV